MGFIREIYSENRAGLVVSFSQTETNESFFAGDSVKEAMKHFNMYEKDGSLFVKTEDSQALNELGIANNEATDFRATVDALIQTMTDEEAIASQVLFPNWQSGKSYTLNERVRYGGKLYKVLQEHTSQDDWAPDAATSLFACLLTDEENGTIQEWTQPDSTNGYVTGDIVSHNGKFYKSMVDNNVWEPGTTGAPWTECAEDGGDIIAEYASGTIYSTGDQVVYNGVVYTSLIDNNSWSPTDYPAGWQEVV